MVSALAKVLAVAVCACTGLLGAETAVTTIAAAIVSVGVLAAVAVFTTTAVGPCVGTRVGWATVPVAQAVSKSSMSIVYAACSIGDGNACLLYTSDAADE